MSKTAIRFNDSEYAILVLQNLKRAVKRSDYFLAYVPPRDVMHDTAEPSEVAQAIQHAIDLIRDNLPD